MSGFRKLQVESPICKFIPHFVYSFHIYLRFPVTFVDSTYILWIPHTFCGIHLELRNPSISYICLLRNSQQNNYADIVYITGNCTRNPQNICKWNPLTFCNMFKDLSLESRNIQTQNFAPIQCTVWPRNEGLTTLVGW